MARLKIVPTVVFVLLMAVALGVALPTPEGNVLAQILPMLPLAAVGLACAAFLALFAHPAATVIGLGLAAAVTLLYSRDPLTALWTLTFALPIVTLRGRLKEKQAATPTVLITAAACLPIWLCGSYFALARAWGMTSPAAMLDRVTADIVASLVTVEIPTATGDVLGYTAEQAAEIARLGIMLLPGLTLFLSATMAWIAWSLTLWLYRLHGLGSLVTDAMRCLTVSRVGAGVFVLAAVASLFGEGELTALEALALNLTLLLEPPLVLVGARGIIRYFRTRESIGGSPLVLLILLLLSCDVSILLLIVAIIGVVQTFRAPAPNPD